MYLALSALMIFGACSKPNEIDELTLTQNRSNFSSGQSYVPDLTECYSGVSVVNGLIKFASVDDMKNTLECLKQKSIEMDDEFLEDYKSLNDSLLNLKMEEISYREEMVYEAFEQHFGIVSLRSRLFDETNDWLNNPPYNYSNHPNHIIGDEPFQTVLTQDGEFMLVDTIYLIDENGRYFRILNGNFNTLDSIKTGTWSKMNRFVETHSPNGGTGRGSCKSSHKSDWWPEYDHPTQRNYTLECQVGFYSIWPVVNGYANSKSYKRKGSKNKSYKTNMDTDTDGTYWSRGEDGDCGDDSESYAKYKDVKKRTSYSADATLWGARRRWDKCYHKGHHYAQTVGHAYYCVNW